MTEEEVVELMQSSKSEKEWTANCVKVKKECGGYPGFWWKAIIMSGLAKDVFSRFNTKEDPLVITKVVSE